LYFFKTAVEPHIGDVQYFKVMSGKVHEGDDFTNADRGSKERIAQIYACAGANRIKVEEMVAGDIGCTVKLKDVHTGNTLNGKGSENRFNFIKYPNSKYSRAIKPLNESDTEKMMVALNRMREEDPTWVIDQSKELRQTIVHGQGEFHLRTLKWRLENNEKLQIKFEEPRIPYRETITKAARADYRHKKQSGGAGQFGEVHLIVEPYYEGMPLPETNGEIIRIGIPPLTEERRKQLAKQCKNESETAKVSVRNARRDAIDAFKKSVKEGLAEDAQKGGEEKLQKIHDKYIKQIDDMLAAKDKEIMTV
jgi:elongation factor G